MLSYLKIRTGITLIAFGVLVSVLAACSASKPASVPEKANEMESNRIDESFDPVILQDEDIEFPASKPVTQSGEGLPLTGAAETQLPVAVENKLMEGFRVQLFATQDIEKATLEKKEAEFGFAEDNVMVYIEFDSPMYKVRIGDCATREEAEQLRELARRRGYPTSWIVKTKVNSNPNLPQTDQSGFDEQ